MIWFRKGMSVILSFSVTVAVMGIDGCSKKQEQPAASVGQAQPSEQAPATQSAVPTAEQLYQLVAPIALFPDNLLAQVLAASTYPDEVSAAYEWLQQNHNLQGPQLAEAVNTQSWDPSVKGLTQFSDVLTQMATNLSWTSALGDAYFNVPQSVMNAVQVMRQRAYQAGNLKSNQQQDVTVQNQQPGSEAPVPASSGEPQVMIVQSPPQTIIIQPAQPQVVYVPTYNPTVVYGAPVATYPGYSTDAMVATSLISFGVGIAVGAAMSNSCCGWGWNRWGCGWHSSTVVYNRNVYVSTSNTFVNRNSYYNRNNITTSDIKRNNINRANVNNRANNLGTTGRNTNFTEPNFNQKYDQPQNRNQGRVNQGAGTPSQPRSDQQPSAGNMQAQNRNSNPNQPQRDAARGYGKQPSTGDNSGAFNGYSPGGNARTNSARGQQSLEARNNGGGGGRQQSAGAGSGRAQGRGGSSARKR